MLYFLVYTKYTQKTFLRILSKCRRPSSVYLAYAEGHHAHTKYKFEEADDFNQIKPPLTQLKSLFRKIPCLGCLKENIVM